MGDANGALAAAPIRRTEKWGVARTSTTKAGARSDQLGWVELAAVLDAQTRLPR